MFEVTLSLIVLQYVRNPITCWSPVHFTGAHSKFMTSYCWVKNTYYVPWTKPIPRFDNDQRQMIPYYQWIPFILLAQVCTAAGYSLRPGGGRGTGPGGGDHEVQRAGI